MDITTTGKIITTNSEINKVMNSGIVVWSGEDDQTGSPGPKIFIGGNSQAGFYGEVPASDFIFGNELAIMIGLAGGSVQFLDGPWLKFSYLGKVEFVAKKPFRNSISWDSINAANAVFGDRTVEIKGKTYKVRLMKGKTEGKQNDSSAGEGDINKGSEWNKLMLPIHKNAPSSWAYPTNVNSPTANWNVGYTDADLHTQSNDGNGTYCWCQEYGVGTNRRLFRGGLGVSYSVFSQQYYDAVYTGWRPVLELVD